MGTGNILKTDLYHLNNYVQNAMITYPKELFIEILRDFFSQDSYYHYQRDQWGFPLTPDHTGLDVNSGLNNDNSTRLYIGEAYRFDVIYYPAILIRNAGSRSIPISMSREQGSVQWEATEFIDGYGNKKIFSTPSYFINAGAWEGQVTVEVNTRSPRSRDELVDIISLSFVDRNFDTMKNSGILIKNINVGAPTEAEDRNDKLFKQTITFDIRSEWRRHTPISTIIDTINFCIDFGNLESNPEKIAPNLRVNTTIDLVKTLIDL